MVEPGAVRWNPFSSHFREDLYSVYQDLRESDPVHRSFAGFWIVSRYADVAGVLHDARFGADLRRWAGYCSRIGQHCYLDWLFSNWILNSDGAEHERLRALFGQALAAVTGPPLEIHIADLVRQLLDAAVQKPGPNCLVRELSHPLPAAVIQHLFAIPPADRPFTESCSRNVALLLEPAPDAASLTSAAKAVEDLSRYFRDLYDRRRFKLGDDMLSHIAALAPLHGCSVDGIMASCLMLFAAGSETTINLIGNSVMTLLRNPRARREILENPRLLRTTAIDEFARFESPVQGIWRTALAPVVIRGRSIAAGDQVLLLLGSANRDPERFEDPDTLVLTRVANLHLGFGAGTHACFGASLGKLQARIALEQLVSRFPTMRLVDAQPQWNPTLSSRGLASLSVHLGTQMGSDDLQMKVIKNAP